MCCQLYKERKDIARSSPLTSSQTFHACCEGLGRCVEAAVHFLPKPEKETEAQGNKRSSRSPETVPL